MSSQMTEYPFLDQLAHRFSLPVPEHLDASAPRPKIRDALERWGGKGVVKADVMSGGRGKARVVKVVDDVQQAMAELRRKRTSFIIAHRLSTIRDADLIVVMDGGRIIEQGTPAELMGRRGAYWAMTRA